MSIHFVTIGPPTTGRLLFCPLPQKVLGPSLCFLPLERALRFALHLLTTASLEKQWLLSVKDGDSLDHLYLEVFQVWSILVQPWKKMNALFPSSADQWPLCLWCVSPCAYRWNTEVKVVNITRTSRVTKKWWLVRRLHLWGVSQCLTIQKRWMASTSPWRVTSSWDYNQQRQPLTSIVHTSHSAVPGLAVVASYPSGWLASDTSKATS